MVAQGNPDKAEIRKCLELVRFVNMRDRYPDWSYFCASVYHEILADSTAACEVLKTLIGNLERKYENRLRKYCTLFDEGEISVQENPIPVEINLLRARVLYKDVLKGVKSVGGDDGLIETLTRICSRSTVASLEKLYYVGDVRVSDLWKIAKKDVLGIQLKYARNRLSRNEIIVDVPINWFLLGEVEAQIWLMRGGKCLTELKEMKEVRSVRKDPDGKGQSLVRMRYTCPAKKLVGVDSIILLFPHEVWPVKITYKPGCGNSFVPRCTPEKRTVYGYGWITNDELPYVATKVSFMGEEQNLMQPAPELMDVMLSQRQKDYSYCLLPFPTKGQRIDVNTNFVVSVEVGESHELNIVYKNETPNQGSLKFDVLCYSSYGAQVCHLTGEVKISGNITGGICQINWPDELMASEPPAWMLLQYNVSHNIWDWWKNRNSTSVQKDKKQ